MANTRLTITLDAKLTKRIRACADRAGMDVSSFIVSAAVHRMTAIDSGNARFVPVDASPATGHG